MNGQHRNGRLVILLIGMIIIPTLLTAQPNGPSNPVVDTDGHMGIGTREPDPSAALDVNSTNRGMLTPRMTSAQRDAIPNPAIGLLIFNTEANTFQYNSGTTFEPIWSELLNSRNLAEFGWALDGNAATSNNFLGTTNSTDLVIKTDSVERMRVTANGAVGIGTANPAVSADINGAVAVQPPATIVVTQDGQTIEVGNRSYLRVDSDSAAYMRTILLTNGLSDGQMLILQCIASCDDIDPDDGDDPDGVFIDSGDNISLGQDYGWSRVISFEMGHDDTLTLIWDAGQGKWVEISRSSKALCGEQPE